MTEQSQTSTALAIPETDQLEALFKAESGLDPLISRLEYQVRAEADGADVSTRKGREFLKSLAFKVSQSKAELERQAKSLTETRRKEIASVNAGRDAAVARLEKLRDETKKPALDWEEQEEKRLAALKDRLSVFDVGRADFNSTSEHIRHVIADIESVDVGEDWQEYREIAASSKDKCLTSFRELLDQVSTREAEAAELDRLRAEAAERERVEAERKAEAERQEAERREAAERERLRLEAEAREAEQKERVARERIKAAEDARKEAEEKAAREQKEAEERHLREIAEAKKREELAAQEERDRLERLRQEEIAAAEKRRADEEHVSRIKTAIRDALATYTAPYGDDDLDLAADLADAIFSGKVPHVEVRA